MPDFNPCGRIIEATYRKSDGQMTADKYCEKGHECAGCKRITELEERLEIALAGVADMRRDDHPTTGEISDALYAELVAKEHENFITWTAIFGEERYEMTFQHHDGLTPNDHITTLKASNATLEAEVERLREAGQEYIAAHSLMAVRLQDADDADRYKEAAQRFEALLDEAPTATNGCGAKVVGVTGARCGEHSLVWCDDCQPADEKKE